MPRYRVNAAVSFEIETEESPKNLAISILDGLLPADYEFAISNLNKIKSGKNLVIADFPLEAVLPFATKEYSRKDYEVDGKTYSVRMNSTRYQIFKENLKCVSCGLEGTFFRLEYGGPIPDRSPHFNLYGMENGEPVLFTKDHILAASKGGRANVGNLQVMCQVCNMLKGNSNLTVEQIGELRKIYTQNRRGVALTTFNRILTKKKSEMERENQDVSQISSQIEN